jgi:ribokinase
MGMEDSRRVLFAGDVNLDLQMTGLAAFPRENRETLCAGCVQAIGGSTTICAVAYATLGGRASLCGLLGEDANGRVLAAMLARTGLDLGMLKFTDRAGTGLTVNLVRESSRTQVTFPGTIALTDETEAILGALGEFEHIHMAGLYPLVSFRPRIAEVLAAAKARGLTTSIDTQWDESELWEGLDEWYPLLDYLFVNEDEALSITKKESVEEAWKLLASRSPCPIVKMGAQGVFAAGRRRPGFRAELVDPTGAGDSFAAAFLFSRIDKGEDFEVALRFAQAAGALCCGYEGGTSPTLTYERVSALAASRDRWESQTG